MRQIDHARAPQSSKPFALPVWALLAGLSLAAPAGAATNLATVNGQKITDKDLQAALGGVNEGQRDNLLKDANTRRQVVGSLIDQEVLVQEAEKSKLDQESEYKEALTAFRRQFLSNRLLEKSLGSRITDASAKKYYEGHKSQFSTDQVHALHILVTDEKQAQDLVKKAQAPGVDFQELAEKFSKDPSAKNNRGDLGFFGQDRMVAEFTSAAFGAKEGTVVGPVRTAYGYHIIKVIKHQYGKPFEYGEVELRVKSALREQMVGDYVTKLRKQAKISIDDAAIDKM